MATSLSRRMARGGFVLACLFALTAARTTVAPLPELIVPGPSDHAVGEAFTAHQGDVILRGNVLTTEVVTLDAPVSVALARFTEELPAGTRLEPVLAPDKTEQLTGTGGRFYCGENQRTRSKFGEVMIGNWFSKYDTEVRFCFVDSDNDHKLDKVFLSGAKDQAEQGARDITPVPFTTLRAQPDARHGTFELRLEKFKPTTNQLTLRLHQLRDGKEEAFSYIVTLPQGVRKETWPDFKTNPAKIAYPLHFNDILGAEVAVLDADAVKGTATLRVNRAIQPQLFKPVSIIYQTIYIYY